jgi:DNA-binding FrmR family transcriptional regulator
MSNKNREQIKLLQRLKRVRGQLEAVERSISAGEDCSGQLMLLAAVRGGVNGLMAQVLETHIRVHLASGSKKLLAPELAEDLIGLVHAYLK